jgi:hypothetical protein
MDPFITKYRELPVFDRYIDQRSIPLFRVLHLQGKENFSGTVHGIHPGAAAFHVNPDLAACLFFRMTNRFHDQVIFFLGEEQFLSF